MGYVILFFGLIIFGFLAVVVIDWYIVVSNYEIRLRNDAHAAQKICQTFFDKMRKTIITQAQIKDDYLNSFNDIFVDIMEGRYANKTDKSGLFNIIKESNPEFSDKIFKNVMKAIDTQRDSFQFKQEKLIGIDAEHITYRSVFPNVLIIGRRPDIGITLITSSETISAKKLEQENDFDIPLNTRRTPK